MNKIFFFLNNIRATVYKSKINAISYIFINIILTISIIGTNVIFRTSTDFLKNMLNNKTGVRSFIIDYDYKNCNEKDAILELEQMNEHIVSVIPQEALSSGGSFKEFQSDNKDGYVNLIGCDNTTLPNLSEGNENDFKDGCCIIPEKIFPDSHIESSFDIKNCYDGKKYIGKTITLMIDINHMDNEGMISIIDHKKKDFKVIGTYDIYETFNNNNDCYISFNDVQEINSLSIDDTIIKSGYSPLIVIADEEKYNNDVLNSINNGKYYATLKEEPNKSAPRILKTITDGICILIYCFAIIISLLLLLGMIKKAKRNISLMKALGYANKRLTFLFFSGFIILILLGYMIGLLIYNILCTLVKSNILEKNYFLSKITIITNSFDIIFPLIPLLIIPFLFLIPIAHKINKINPLDLWKSEKK